LSKTAASNHFFSDFFYVSWTVALRAQGSHACDALLGQMQAPAGNPEGQWPLPRLSGKHGKLKKYKERRDQMRDATGCDRVPGGRLRPSELVSGVQKLLDPGPGSRHFFAGYLCFTQLRQACLLKRSQIRSVSFVIFVTQGPFRFFV
jgi:hypothetical protein